MEAATPDGFIRLALLTGESQDDTPRCTQRQRQAHADAHVVAHRLGPFDPRDARSLLALSDVERRALLGLLGQGAQGRLDHVVDAETRLVAGPKPTGGRAEPPLALLALHHVARSRQRTRQTQHGAVVQSGPATQLGQGQVALANAERLHHLQGSRDGDDTPYACRRGFGGCHCRRGPLEVTERAVTEILSLPLYPELTDEEAAFVIEGLRKAMREE